MYFSFLQFLVKGLTVRTDISSNHSAYSIAISMSLPMDLIYILLNDLCHQVIWPPRFIFTIASCSHIVLQDNLIILKHYYRANGSKGRFNGLALTVLEERRIKQGGPTVLEDHTEILPQCVVHVVIRPARAELALSILAVASQARSWIGAIGSPEYPLTIPLPNVLPYFLWVFSDFVS